MRSAPGIVLALAFIVPCAAATRTLDIMPARSTIVFTVERPREIVEGRAHRFSGRVRVDPERPGEGAFAELLVEAASLETGNRLRDRKMRRAHLEVERFPKIRFRTVEVRLSAAPEAGSGAPLAEGERRRAVITGVLALHGVEREILFPVAIRYDDGSLTAEGELEFRFTDHDIRIPRFLWLILDDSIRVRFRLVAEDPGGAGGTPGSDLPGPDEGR